MKLIRVLLPAVAILGPGWEAGAQSTPPFEQQVDVVYGQSHGTALVLDIFRPTGPANGLGVVDVASGAWHSDRGKIRDHQTAGLYNVFCSRGFTVFALRPGSVSKYTGEEMVQNVLSGVRWVRSRSADFAVDAERLAIVGASAGGHLALMAAVRADDGKPDGRDPLERLPTRLKAVAVFFPPTTFLDWGGNDLGTTARRLGRLFFPDGLVDEKSDEELRQALAAISPREQVPLDMPPVLIFHGDADPVVPLEQSQMMVAAMREKGLKVELRIKPGGGHPWIPMTTEITQMAEWLEERLRAD